MARTYYIFRHGLTREVQTGTGYGENIFSAPIIDEGKEAIKRMANYLKDKQVDFCVSSPLKRCRQTAEIVSKLTGGKFVFDERLTEFFMETRDTARERIERLLSEIDKKGLDKVAVCTHGSIISILISLLTASDTMLKSYDLFHYPDPGMLVIIKDGILEEINFN